MSEKRVLQAEKDLAKPLIRKKIAKTTQTHYAHKAKWEIPGENAGHLHEVARE